MAMQEKMKITSASRLCKRVLELGDWINQSLVDANCEVKFELKGNDPVDKANSFFKELETGVVLCKLMNVICPDFALRPFHSAPSRSFLARDNIHKFISSCRTLGIPTLTLFEVDDLVLRRNDKTVVATLLWLALCAHKRGVKVPERLARFGSEHHVWVEETEKAQKVELAKAEPPSPLLTPNANAPHFDFSIPTGPALPARLAAPMTMPKMSEVKKLELEPAKAPQIRIHGLKLLDYDARIGMLGEEVELNFTHEYDD